MKRLLRPLAIIVVAAIVGFVLARAGGSHSHTDSLNRTGTTAAFSLRYPSGWHPGDPPRLTDLTLSDAFAAGPSTSERLAVGRVRATAVGTLPTTFLRSLSGRRTPVTVQLGPYRFDRYLDLSRPGGGGVVSVYLLATTSSTIVGVCTASAAGSAFTAECERVLATLRLRGAAASGGVDTAYALGLNAVLAKLNPVRRSAGPGLQAASVATRARAARRLASAEGTAADGAARLSAGSAAAINRQLVGALRSAAGGYRRLATAAVADDVPSYKAAESTLQVAQRTLATAFARLGRLGYRLR